MLFVREVFGTIHAEHEESSRKATKEKMQITAAFVGHSRCKSDAERGYLPHSEDFFFEYMDASPGGKVIEKAAAFRVQSHANSRLIQTVLALLSVISATFSAGEDDTTIPLIQYYTTHNGALWSHNTGFENAKLWGEEFPEKFAAQRPGWGHAQAASPCKWSVPLKKCRTFAPYSICFPINMP